MHQKAAKVHQKCIKFKSASKMRSEEHTSELQSRQYLVCRLLLEKKNNKQKQNKTTTIDRAGTPNNQMKYPEQVCI